MSGNNVAEIYLNEKENVKNSYTLLIQKRRQASLGIYRALQLYRGHEQWESHAEG